MKEKRVPSRARTVKAKSADKNVSSRKMLEEMLRELSPLMQGGDLTVDDLSALIASLEGPSGDEQLTDGEVNAKYEAQELAFDAMEARSAGEAHRFAKRALRLDPDCVDALLVLCDLDARTVKARIAGLEKAVAAGERSLGEKFMREGEGHFWMLIETRPYMRALEQLGGEMTAAGMLQSAIAVYEKMLRLNPNDNQGVRDPLLGLYLAADDVKGARRLLKRYQRDASACFAWGSVVALFLAGEYEKTRTALRKAMQANRFVALHLTGREQLPMGQPEMYSPGSAEESALCLHYLSTALSQHKEMVFWLYDQITEMGMAPIPGEDVLRKMKVPKGMVQ
ncbi:MAG: tetratricopeptide repeat protein [Acidobacteriota bacterium]